MEIFRNQYLIADRDSMLGILRVTRTSEEFKELEDIDGSYQALFRVLDRMQRPTFCLLVDLRRSPGRSDPKFEGVMRRIRPQLFRGFRRCGILVRSASGVRQVSQHTKEDGYSILVGNSEAELVHFLTDGKLHSFG
ncbi:MAG: hypothetical protein JNM40_01985 [Myxococcales bacterium]|nr:hypothetical protein [Myxococcales bacterium]